MRRSKKKQLQRPCTTIKFGRGQTAFGRAKQLPDPTFWDAGHGAIIAQIIEGAKKENHNMIAINYGDYCLLYCVGVMIPPMVVGIHRGQVVSIMQSGEDPLPQCILDEIERRSGLEQENGGFDYKNIDVAETVLMNI